MPQRDIHEVRKQFTDRAVDVGTEVEVRIWGTINDVCCRVPALVEEGLQHVELNSLVPRGADRHGSDE